MLADLTGILVWLAMIPAVVFPILYAVRSPWRKTLVGRSLMQLAVSLAVILTLAVLNAAFGVDYPGRPMIRLVVFTLVVVALWRQVVVLVLVQNDNERKRYGIHTNKEVHDSHESHDNLQ